MAQSYSLLVKSVTGIYWKPRWFRSLYVAIDVDGTRVHHTHPKKKAEEIRNELATLSPGSPSSIIALQVFSDPSFGKDTCLAKKEIELAVLVEMCGQPGETKDIAVALDHTRKTAAAKPGPVLVVRMTPLGWSSAGDIVIANAMEDVAALEGSSGLLSALRTLVSRLDVVVQIGAGIAKIHPYANAAWQVLTSVYNVIKAQQEIDVKFIKLVQTLVEVYDFAKDVASLSEKMRSLEDAVAEIVRETAKCAIFVREYVGSGFGARVLTQVTSKDNEKIEEFTAVFAKLRQSLGNRLAIYTASASTKILEIVVDSAQAEKLKTLDPVKMDAALRSECLPGTRREILSSITTWLTTPPNLSDPSNILWLYAVAGAGKSTIATSVSQYFRGLDALGAFLFFNRSDRTASSPSTVIRTIAYYLARSNIHLASAICTALDNDPNLPDAPIGTQFKNLLLEPLTAAQNHIHGPIVVILDALDECGDAKSRQSLVSLLSRDFLKLPSVFRFFITSRPDSDITDKFLKQPRIVEKHLDITLPSSLKDIHHYIDHQMVAIREQHSTRNLGPSWPGTTKITALATLSSGLFIWASTAVGFLLEAHNPGRTLDTLLDKGLNLDDLYSVALRNAGPWDDMEFRREAQVVLTAVVLGKVPMSDGTIDRLLCLEHENSSRHIFARLGCVLQWKSGQVARVLHTSFGDYLTDPGRSGCEPWFIDSSVLGRELAHGCLRILRTELQFNICRFEDSHKRNTDVHDLPARIAAYIPPHLSYSSRFWASHLEGADFDPNTLADTKDFMFHKFLFWLEVISILQETATALDALVVVRKLAEAHNDSGLTAFATDAVKFVSAFAPVIAHSVPHIYLSAVPLAPRESEVAQKFSGLFTNKVEVQGALAHQWPRSRVTIEGHSQAVMSAAFSHDGQHIVSGSADETVRVWDAQTGAFVAGPFQGHKSWVWSVSFSPNGEQIASGASDGTIRVWDVQTGALVATTLETRKICCLAFSPSGEWIVSGSIDAILRVWDARTAGLLSLFEGHKKPVSCVAVSPDGMRIVSGSGDGLCVWDPQTSAVLVQPWNRSDDFHCVAFSPDGERVVSGSEACVVQVWNSRTGALMAGPFKGHTKAVLSLSVSFDGENIASGSEDGTVCLWDAQTGTLFAGPFREHGDSVRSVSFSPNGKQLVTASEDHTLRLWDLPLTPEVVEQRAEAHLVRVISVAFSPGGDQIASLSDDGTFHLWDARTGVLVSGPFKGHCGGVAFLPNGEHVVSGSTNATVGVWDFRTGALVAGPFLGHTDDVTCVAVSRSGEHVASGSLDTTVCLWNMKRGALVAEPFRVHGRWVRSVCFSPNGERLVSGSADGTVCMWDVRVGTIICGPFNADKSQVLSVAFLSDANRILVGGAMYPTVRVWDSRAGILAPERLTGHTSYAPTVSMSQSGEQIVTGSQDTTVRVWDAQTMVAASGPFEGHTGVVGSTAFSPDGRRVVSGSDDRTIRVSEIDPTSHQQFANGSWLKDGWIVDSGSELILWVPPWLRRGLYYPHNSLVISTDGTAKLDFSQFVHGTSWQGCIDPNNPNIRIN